MDSAWIGTISALAGAFVGGAISMLRDWRAGKRQEVRDDAQRRHEVVEHRFDARREAYVTFGAALRSTVLGSLRFEEDHGGLPGEYHDDVSHPVVEDALAMLEIVGPSELVDEAERAAKCLLDWAFGPPGPSHADVQAAIASYTTLARKTLKFDEAP